MGGWIGGWVGGWVGPQVGRLMHEPTILHASHAHLHVLDRLRAAPVDVVVEPLVRRLQVAIVETRVVGGGVDRAHLDSGRRELLPQRLGECLRGVGVRE